MKISKDILLSTAAKSIESAESQIADLRLLLSTFQHEHPRLSPLLRLIASTLSDLAEAHSRLLDVVRGEHS